MTITAQQKTEQVSNDQFELFETETVLDVDGKEVTIPKSIGTFTVSQLESQKASYQTRIDDIDVKLSAINKIK